MLILTAGLAVYGIVTQKPIEIVLWEYWIEFNKIWLEIWRKNDQQIYYWATRREISFSILGEGEIPVLILEYTGIKQHKVCRFF
jgi:hypothetical protein